MKVGTSSPITLFISLFTNSALIFPMVTEYSCVVLCHCLCFVNFLNLCLPCLLGTLVLLEPGIVKVCDWKDKFLFKPSFHLPFLSQLCDNTTYFWGWMKSSIYHSTENLLWFFDWFGWRGYIFSHSQECREKTNQEEWKIINVWFSILTQMWHCWHCPHWSGLALCVSVNKKCPVFQN